MSQRVFVHLPCAFSPPWVVTREQHETRDQEFVRGFRSLFEVLTPLMHEGVQAQVFDNTVSDLGQVSPEILAEIPEWCKVVLAPGHNRFGWKNKGAGTIEGWSFVQEKSLLTDWFVHHEPRTEIHDPRFLTECLTLGPTRVADRGDHFYTGTLAMRSYDVNRFVEETDLFDMVTRSVSIEYSLREWILDRVPARKLHLYPDAGVLWHDTATGKTEKM